MAAQVDLATRSDSKESTGEVAHECSFLESIKSSDSPEPVIENDDEVSFEIDGVAEPAEIDGEAEPAEIDGEAEPADDLASVPEPLSPIDEEKSLADNLSGKLKDFRQDDFASEEERSGSSDASGKNNFLTEKLIAHRKIQALERKTKEMIAEFDHELVRMKTREAEAERKWIQEKARADQIEVVLETLQSEKQELLTQVNELVQAAGRVARSSNGSQFARSSDGADGADESPTPSEGLVDVIDTVTQMAQASAANAPVLPEGSMGQDAEVQQLYEKLAAHVQTTSTPLQVVDTPAENAGITKLLELQALADLRQIQQDQESTIKPEFLSVLPGGERSTTSPADRMQVLWAPREQRARSASPLGDRSQVWRKAAVIGSPSDAGSVATVSPQETFRASVGTGPVLQNLPWELSAASRGSSEPRRYQSRPGRSQSTPAVKSVTRTTSPRCVYRRRSPSPRSQGQSPSRQPSLSTPSAGSRFVHVRTIQNPQVDGSELAEQSLVRQASPAMRREASPLVMTQATGQTVVRTSSKSVASLPSLALIRQSSPSTIPQASTPVAQHTQQVMSRQSSSSAAIRANPSATQTVSRTNSPLLVASRSLTGTSVLGTSLTPQRTMPLSTWSGSSASLPAGGGGSLTSLPAGEPLVRLAMSRSGSSEAWTPYGGSISTNAGSAVGSHRTPVPSIPMLGSARSDIGSNPSMPPSTTTSFMPPSTPGSGASTPRRAARGPPPARKQSQLPRLTSGVPWNDESQTGLVVNTLVNTLEKVGDAGDSGSEPPMSQPMSQMSSLSDLHSVSTKASGKASGVAYRGVTSTTEARIQRNSPWQTLGQALEALQAGDAATATPRSKPVASALGLDSNGSLLAGSGTKSAVVPQSPQALTPRTMPLRQVMATTPRAASNFSPSPGPRPVAPTLGVAQGFVQGATASPIRGIAAPMWNPVPGSFQAGTFAARSVAPTVDAVQGPVQGATRTLEPARAASPVVKAARVLNQIPVVQSSAAQPSTPRQPSPARQLSRLVTPRQTSPRQAQDQVARVHERARPRQVSTSTVQPAASCGLPAQFRPMGK